jgi:hypothetical protein
MITLRIDRRALFVLGAVALVAVPLGLGMVLGRGVSGSDTVAVATTATNSVSVVTPEGAQPTSAADAAAAAVPRIAVEDAHSKLGQPDAVFIDARTADQFAQGHIAGAISVPEIEAASAVDKLPKDKDLILYCA